MQRRQPFDPSRIAFGPAEAPPAEGTLTVRQVNELVRGAIARHLPTTLHVLGEIGDCSRAASGHLYFTLKDEHSELRCVMWRSAAVRLRFELQTGLAVIATGGVEVYAPRGTYQLVVRRIEPRGVGALEIAFRQLKTKLEREGLFDERRKRELPRFPERIAVITSASGAAIRDILKTIARRFPAIEVLLFPVRVQGEGAAAEIAAAIALMNQHAESLGGIDVAIVGRGGGSLEDLWAFNEEVVARAIAASRIPIVSAVGHEIDLSISDLVADVRAATPTAAAELVTPHVDDLRSWLDRQVGRCTRTAAHALELARSALKAVLAYEGLARPLARLREQVQLVDERQARLVGALVERVASAGRRLTRCELVILRFGTGADFARWGRRLDVGLLRVERCLDRRLAEASHQQGALVARLQTTFPGGRLARVDERIRQSLHRLTASLQAWLTRLNQRVQERAALAAACHPGHVLARGFSITRDARTGRVIRSTSQVHDRQRLRTQVADGEFRSTAEDPRQPKLFED
jgi:exodeoxyribonuclease VII large subunit